MTFPEFLRAEVLRLGDGVSSRGEALAAIVLDWSPRKIRNVMYGQVISFYLGRELWGSAWRCNDRGRMVCFDHTRTASGKTETLVTVHKT